MNSADDKASQISYLHEEFSDFGALAYVKPISTARGQGYAVCAADGTQLAVFQDKEVAIFAARQHDLEPVQMH